MQKSGKSYLLKGPAKVNYHLNMLLLALYSFILLNSLISSDPKFVEPEQEYGYRGPKTVCLNI